MGFRVRASLCALAICIVVGIAHADRTNEHSEVAASISFDSVSPLDYEGDVRELAAQFPHGASASDANVTHVGGDVGPQHYIQTAGDGWGVFEKSSGALLARFTAAQLWSRGDARSPCVRSHDAGVTYDAVADRWVLSGFSDPAPAQDGYACFAVSKTAQPLHGGYYLYAVPLQGYAANPVARLQNPRFGVTGDCLLMGATSATSDAESVAMFAAFQRNALYAGEVLGPRNSSIGMLPSQAESLVPVSASSAHASFASHVARDYFLEQARDSTLLVRAFDNGATPCAAGASMGPPVSVTENGFFTAGAAYARAYRDTGGTESLWLPLAHCRTGAGGAACDDDELGVTWLSIDLPSASSVAAVLPVAQVQASSPGVVRVAGFAGLALEAPHQDKLPSSPDLAVASTTDGSRLPALTPDPTDSCILWFSDAGTPGPERTTRIGALRTAGCSLPAAAGTKLAFAQQPSNTKAGVSITPAITVQVQDGTGTLDPTSTASVSIAIGANPGGATLSGTTTVAAVAGVATFNNLKLDKAGTGYTLTVSSSGLAGATSAAFNITAGNPASITFSTQPTNAVAGAVIAVAAHVQDANGNPVSADNVTLAIASNSGGSTLSVTTNPVATNASGDAVFNGVSLNKVGSYTLSARESSAAFLTVTSSAFSISPGAATAITFSTQPVNAVAGATMFVAARVLDANGNGIAGKSVTLAIANNPGGSTLSVSANPSTTNVSGDAFFVNTSLDKSGIGYTLKATDSSTPALTVTSNAFNIAAGAPAAISFSTQPVSSTAGATIPVVAHVQDSHGNPVSGDNVTLAIANNSGGSALTVTTNPVATNVSGNASFSGVSLNKSGAGYTLKVTDASAPALTVTSSAFAITAGAPAAISFSTQPVSSAAGATIPVVAHVQDANANPVAGVNVTLAIANNAGGATLTVTANPVATNASGNATFAGVSLNKIGSGYTLGASDASAPALSVNSSAFNITTGPAAAVSFSTQPGNAVAGATIPVVAHVQDAGGNPVAGDSVTLAIANNVGGSTLSVTTNPVITNASGDATFAGVSLNKRGSGYTLTATDASTPALTATSSAFNISAGAPSAISFAVQPGNAAAGATIAVTAHVQDANGNPVSGDNITLAILNNPGASTLSVTTNPLATNANGDAAFAGVSLNKSGTGYTLKATDASTPALSATSNAFNITAGAPATITFTTQPSSSTAGATIAVVARVRDAGGNPVSGDSVTLAIAANPGGSTLSVTTNPVSTNAAGNASFAGVSLDKSGTGYTLRATDASTPALNVTSNTFDISAGAAAALAFSAQPSNTAAGANIAPAVAVQVRDSHGNAVTSSTASITIAIANNAGGATLTGTTSVSAVAGIASFATLNLDKSGSGYTLAASSTGLTGATSASFNVTAGAPASIAFSTQPGNATVGASIPVVAHVQDANGNPVPGDNVTLAIANNPGAATLSVTGNPVATDASGNATFNGVSLNKSGSGYTLRATDASAPALSATSTAFNISASVPAAISFATQPANAIAGAAIPVVVHVQDVGGNPIAGDSVTLSIVTNPGGSTLTVTTNPVPTNGSGDAVFSGVALNRSGTGYKLRATDASTPALSANSSAFNIAAGAAAQLVFTTQPANVLRGDKLAAIVVTEQDANGNTVANDSANVAFTTQACAGTVSLGSVAMNAGVATLASPQRFYTLATGLRIAASRSALSVNSSTFNVTANAEYIFADGVEACRL